MLLLADSIFPIVDFFSIVPMMPSRNNRLSTLAIGLDISRVCDQGGKVYESFVEIEEYKDLLVRNHPESKISLGFTDR